MNPQFRDPSVALDLGLDLVYLGGQEICRPACAAGGKFLSYP
jgi:hypothetical protein